jgi:hypothetical protein
MGGTEVVLPRRFVSEYMGDWSMAVLKYATDAQLISHIEASVLAVIREWGQSRQGMAHTPQGYLDREVTHISADVFRHVAARRFRSNRIAASEDMRALINTTRWHIIGIVKLQEHLQLVVEIEEPMADDAKAVSVKDKATYIFIHNLIAVHLKENLTSTMLENGITSVVLPKEQSTLDSDVLMQLMDDAFITDDCQWKMASLGRPQPNTPRVGFSVNIEAVTLEDL